MIIAAPDAILIALAGALTALVKHLALVPNRFLPLVSVGIALFLAVLIWLADAFPPYRFFIQAVLVGLVAGLTASGFYDTMHEPSKPPTH